MYQVVPIDSHTFGVLQCKVCTSQTDNSIVQNRNSYTLRLDKKQQEANLRKHLKTLIHCNNSGVREVLR